MLLLYGIFIMFKIKVSVTTWQDMLHVMNMFIMILIMNCRALGLGRGVSDPQKKFI